MTAFKWPTAIPVAYLGVAVAVSPAFPQNSAVSFRGSFTEEPTYDLNEEPSDNIPRAFVDLGRTAEDGRPSGPPNRPAWHQLGCRRQLKPGRDAEPAPPFVLSVETVTWEPVYALARTWSAAPLARSNRRYRPR